MILALLASRVLPPFHQVACDAGGLQDHVCTDVGHAWVIRASAECALEGPEVDLALICPGAIGIGVTQAPPIIVKVDGQFSTGFAAGAPANGWSYWSNSHR